MLLHSYSISVNMDYFVEKKEASNELTPIHCVIGQPQYLSIGESEFHSGCAIIEVVFPNMTLVNIGKIAFVNNYTAHICLKAKVCDFKCN